uniref:Candidate secreted effector n=1 Tax=Meloidogyne incognita TaxID=6306 RepID=A0A914M2A9_MELIC
MEEENKCRGNLIERKACDAGPCCEWSIWSEWSNCQINCNNKKRIQNEGGFRQRKRECIFIFFLLKINALNVLENGYKQKIVIPKQPQIVI